ncbi:Uncharacterised protein [Mycobacteroides abscessus subsp. abscessus]|nr:hypothetical protein [Mycobacteroides abscessus]SHV87875.1 Uncharacterised protein [Mycobacteroides abscessus subsp. abscessus]SHW41140.1 Uncharacterised protein [Mycobacteroides abscessus subsp. abscessus]SIC36719.1 Uncharacterised protein [Mycobacteroides abscessus subsp. abscessus]SII24118.1 Uncharacterised protein [Mycobacteroides abscessus subsp. abscessus]
MTDIEPPLSPVERLALVSLYARLTVSQNRPSSGLLVSESACYADLNISSPETMSHKRIPVTRLSEGSGTC